MEPITCLQDMEDLVRKKAGDEAADFASFAADDGQTTKDNEDAFSRLHLKPRYKRASAVEVTTSILGQKVALPVGISPSACHGQWTSKGEVATAAAAKAFQTIYVQSAAFNQLEENIAAVSESKLHWMLVLVRTSKAFIEERIRVAETLGYGAIVLAADSPIVGRRRAFLKKPFIPRPNLNIYPVLDEDLIKTFSGISTKSTTPCVQHPTLIWEDLLWMRTLTNLPIILKGILTGEDARLAVEYGAAAVWVSNHGGRKMDTVPAAVDVLPEVVRAVNGQAEVYVDSGVRSGEDVLKALALGANFVFLGRPVVWGLTYNGEEGVMKVFDILKRELKEAMKQTGCASVPQITRDIVWRKPYIPAAHL